MKKLIFSILIAFLAVPGLIKAEIKLVPSDYATIQLAVDDCNDGDEVVVEDGVYRGTGFVDIYVKNKSITIRSLNGPDNCIFDGYDVTLKNNLCIFRVDDDSNTIYSGVFEGFTIKDFKIEGTLVNSYKCNFTVNNCRFQGCYGRNGVIRNSLSDFLIVNDCVIKNADVYMHVISSINADTVEINRTKIIDSFSQSFALINISGADKLVISDSMLTQNRYYLLRSAYTNKLVIKNSIIAENRWADGTLLNCSGKNVELTNNTIINNISHNKYATNVLTLNGSENAYITNTLIWGNDPNQVLDSQGDANVSYCNIQGGWPGEGNINIDPNIFSDGHILASSCCIDAGTNDPCGGLEPNDIEGFFRPVDGDNDGNAIADIGAYEFVADSAMIATSESEMEFLYQHEPISSQNLTITNAGGQSLDFEISTDVNWLEVTPGTWMISGEPIEAEVSVVPESLEAGDYIGTITITDANAVNSPKEVKVYLHVARLLLIYNYGSIQAAVDDARDNDVVLLTKGQYTGAGNVGVNVFNKSLVIRSQNDPVNCIIDCEEAGRAFNIYSESDISSIPPATNITIEGITIQNGNASVGGAIYCWEGREGDHLTVKNCIFKNNTSDRGAAIHSWNFIFDVNDCSFSGNTGSGGVLYYDNDYRDVEYKDDVFELNVENCEFVDNQSAAINLYDSPFGVLFRFNVIDCNMTGNSFGDSIIETECLLGDYELNLTRCNISNNYPDLYGSALKLISYEDSKVNIVDCAINSHHGQGVGIYNYSGLMKLYMKDSQIIGNRGYYPEKNYAVGAGLNSSYDSAAVTLENCIIAGNICIAQKYAYGAGVYCDEGILELNNCIVIDNKAISFESEENNDYGGVYSRCSSFVNNSIVYGNSVADDGCQIYFEDPNRGEILYSDIEGSWAGLGNIDADPCFVRGGVWDSNGTADVSDDFYIPGDYHLKSQGWRWDSTTEVDSWVQDDVTSKCIDAGNPGRGLGDEPITIAQDANNDFAENIRINMGVYGGTSQASMGPTGWSILSDLNNDSKVDFKDYSWFMSWWLIEEQCQPGDVNRDGRVDYFDLSLFSNDWLIQN